MSDIQPTAAIEYPIPVPNSPYTPGTILLGRYINNSPRWYKVVKETTYTVTAVRLKHKALNTLPSMQEQLSSDGKRTMFRMTKKNGALTYYTMTCIIWDGNPVDPN